MTQSRQPALSLGTTYNYVTRALQLLEKPGPGIDGSSWIKFAEAVTADGKQHVKPEDERAAGWCFIGVLKAVTKYDDDPDAAYRYVYSIVNAANISLTIANDGAMGKAGSAPRLNDSAYSFEEVRRLLVNTQNFLIRKGA